MDVVFGNASWSVVTSISIAPKFQLHVLDRIPPGRVVGVPVSPRGRGIVIRHGFKSCKRPGLDESVFVPFHESHDVDFGIEKPPDLTGLFFRYVERERPILGLRLQVNSRPDSTHTLRDHAKRYLDFSGQRRVRGAKVRPRQCGPHLDVLGVDEGWTFSPSTSRRIRSSPKGLGTSFLDIVAIVACSLNMRRGVFLQEQKKRAIA